MEALLETHDERMKTTSPEDMFVSAYANICMSSDDIMKLAERNVGNITRKEILKIKKQVRDAIAALEGLDCWRKLHPHPEDPKKYE